ncbi:MAG: helical backbone metal receptor [Candidatus Omnitrophota bacterium]|jgi:iron complex transport system substrate-binding protein
MKKIFLIIVVLSLTSLCSAEAAPRVISLAPNTTEILFSLGLGDSIVGLDDFSNYPEGVRNIERLGTFNNPNMERIILLKPDYILINSGLEKAREDYLMSLGVKIIKVSPKTMDGLYSDIRELGEIFNKKENAEALIIEMRSKIEDVSRNIKGKAPKVFIQLFDDPLITVSSFISDTIRLAGGENIAQDMKDDTGIFSYEALIERDPDIILVAGFSGNSIGFHSISAVKNKRIYRDLDPDLILRPGPRAAEAVEKLNRIFYE